MVRKLFRTTKLELGCDRCEDTYFSPESPSLVPDEESIEDGWSHGRFDSQPVIEKADLHEFDLCPECTKAFIELFMDRIQKKEGLK